jgi:hypothetical protein
VQGLVTVGDPAALEAQAGAGIDPLHIVGGMELDRHETGVHDRGSGGEE